MSNILLSNNMLRRSLFAVLAQVGWQTQEHLPLSSTLTAELTDGALTLWRESRVVTDMTKHHARDKPRGHDSKVMRIFR